MLQHFLGDKRSIVNPLNKTYNCLYFNLLPIIKLDNETIWF